MNHKTTVYVILDAEKQTGKKADEGKDFDDLTRAIHF